MRIAVLNRQGSWGARGPASLVVVCAALLAAAPAAHGPIRRVAPIFATTWR